MRNFKQAFMGSFLGICCVANAADLFPVHVKIFGVEPSKSSLRKTAKQFNPKAEIRSYGDASTGEERVCFAPKDRSDLVVQFAMQSEMGAPDTVSEIRILLKDVSSSYYKCNPVHDSSIKIAQLELPKGIRLDMLKSEVEKKLGKLDVIETTDGVFTAQKMICSPYQKKLELCRGFNLGFTNAKVSAIEYSAIVRDPEQ